MRCECDENTMMSCLRHPHAMQTMMTWCSYNENTSDIMPPISTWHKWNANAGDVMVTWFASYATPVRSCWACALCAHVHGAHTIIKMGTSKYLNGLTGMPADSNLGKLTASHFEALITPNANENMPSMFPLVYLNVNLRFCNENLVWGKCEPLIHPYMFWHSTKGEKVVKNSFSFIYL